MSVKISSLNTASTISSGDDINIAGNNPLYFSDWGGGWYMQDGTWMRNYGKSLWIGSGVYGTDGGLTIGYGGANPPSGGAIIAGNVGIGTSTPATKLGVAGDITLQLSGAAIRDINSNALLSVQYSNELWLGGGGVGFSTIFYAGGAERMRITSAGNVGIGTTSPGAALEVFKSSGSSVIRANYNNTTTFDLTASSGGNVFLSTGANAMIFENTAERMRITSGGNVLIGTTTDSGYKFYVNGTGRFSNDLIGVNGISDSLYSRITSPGGGTSLNNAPITAAIKIALPADGSFLNTMISFTIHIYTYSTGKSRTIKVGGYSYYDTSWYNVFTYQSGGSQIDDINIRFGTEGGCACVWIGETTSYWDYPNIFITDVQVGHSQSPNLTKGWNVSLVSSFGTVQSTYVAYKNITTYNIGSQSVSYATTAGALTSMLISQFTNDSGYVTSGALAAYLPLAGGTLTGALNGTSASFSGNVNADDYSLASWKILDWTSSVAQIGGISASQWNQLEFFTSGTSKLTITNTGNVGIGTTTPATKLQVVGGYISTKDNAAYGGAFMEGDNGIVHFGSLGTDNVSLYSSGTRLFINGTSGNVGIGTTNPATKLDVNGSVKIANGENLTWGGAYGAGIPTIAAAISSGISFYPAGSTSGESMRITSMGNVGIGTNAPTRILELKQGEPYLRFNPTANSAPYLMGAADGKFYIIPESTYVPTMTFSSGNVGIGTTSPSAALEVFKSSGSSVIRANYNNTTTFDLTASSGGNVFLSTGANAMIFENTAERMRIASNGNVGIGTNTPAAKLHIQDTNGGVFFDGVGATYNRFKSTTSSAATGKDLLFSAQSAGTTPDLYIKSDGKVGIGTSAPSYTLDVNGTARVSGRLEITTADQITNRITLLNQTSSNRWDIVGGLNGTNQTDFSIYDNTNSITALRIVPSTGAATFSSSVTASSFIKSGGTSTQFLKADGSIDSNTYATTSALAGYLPLTGGNLTGLVISTANIEATAFRTDGNFELTSALTGLKSNFYDTRFYASNTSYWTASTAAAATNGALLFRQGYEGTAKGYIYWDSSGFGLLNNLGGWSVRTNSGSNYGGTLYGNWIVRSMNVDSGSIIFKTSADVTKGSVTWDDQGFGLINNQGDYSLLCYQGSSYGGLLKGTWTSTGNFDIIGAELSINSNATSTYSKITYRSSLDPNSYDWYSGMAYDPTAEETYYYIRYIDGNQFRVYPDGTIYINGGAFSQYSATGNYISVGNYGLYSATYSSYIRTNTTASSYAAWDVTGAKGGYTGFVYNTSNLPHVMFNTSNGNGGLYYQTGSRWVMYYDYTNNSLGIGGTTTDATYKLYVNGNVRVVGTFNLSTLITNGAVYSIGGGLTNTNPSDIRLKEDINPLQYGLKEVMALNPVTYKWKDGSNNGQRSTGLIAQDVKEVMPDYVKNVSEDSDLLGLDSYAINIVLINAIKELQAEIEILKNK